MDITLINNNGTIKNILSINELFNNKKCLINKIGKIADNKYLSLINIFDENASKFKAVMLFFDNQLNVLDFKYLADTTKNFSINSFIINSRNQIVSVGNKLKDNSYFIDSLYIGIYDLNGSLLKSITIQDSLYPTGQSIIELTHFGKYVINQEFNSYQLFIDTNFESAKMVQYMIYIPQCNISAISDRKFIQKVATLSPDPNNNMLDIWGCGFVVQDTTPSPLYFDTITPPAELYEFGEYGINSFDGFIFYLNPDTVYVIYNFSNQVLSNKVLYRIIKSSTKGQVFWSRTYTSDIDRRFSITATTSEIVLFGGYIDNITGNYSPIIIRLNKDGNVLNIEENFIFENSDILIYPNPSNDYLKIIFLNKTQFFSKLEIYNCFGKKMYSENIVNSNFIYINVSNFVKGNYLINFYGKNIFESKKIVVC